MRGCLTAGSLSGCPLLLPVGKAPPYQEHGPHPGLHTKLLGTGEEHQPEWVLARCSSAVRRDIHDMVAFGQFLWAGNEMRASMLRPKAAISIAIPWFLVNAADALSTWVVIAGGGYELNPLLLPFSGSLFGLLSAKLVMAAVVCYLLLRWKRTKWLVALNTGLLGVVMWNLSRLVVLYA